MKKDKSNVWLKILPLQLVGNAKSHVASSENLRIAVLRFLLKNNLHVFRLSEMKVL